MHMRANVDPVIANIHPPAITLSISRGYQFYSHLSLCWGYPPKLIVRLDQSGDFNGYV